VVRSARSDHLESYASGGKILVRSHMLDTSKCRGRQKVAPGPLGWGLSTRLTTSPSKTIYLKKPNNEWQMGNLEKQQRKRYKGNEIYLATWNKVGAWRVQSVQRLATGWVTGVGARVPVGSRIFSSPHHPDRFWGPPSLLSNGYRGLFPRR
jgi:hypothetical protein